MNTSAIESALRVLERAQFPVAELWALHAAREQAREGGVPTEDDTRYAIPAQAPAISGHLEGGKNEVMSASNLWKGYAYALSPGQRQWLRERFEMVPTPTATVVELSTWPGTQHPREMTLRWDRHLDSDLRRKMSTCVTISCVGKFLRESAVYDEQRLAVDEVEDKAERATKPRKGAEFATFLEALGQC